MNWRVVLTLVLLAGAILSGWSVWRQNADHATTATAGGRSDYVLHDFELVALDGTTGKEAFTLRAPTLQRNPGDRTMSLTTPLFLVPDDDVYWGTRLACVEMIRTGTVRFWDMYWRAGATARAVEDAGLRATIGEVVIDVGDAAGDGTISEVVERGLEEIGTPAISFARPSRRTRSTP